MISWYQHQHLHKHNFSMYFWSILTYPEITVFLYIPFPFFNILHSKGKTSTGGPRKYSHLDINRIDTTPTCTDTNHVHTPTRARPPTLTHAKRHTLTHTRPPTPTHVTQTKPKNGFWSVKNQRTFYTKIGPYDTVEETPTYSLCSHIWQK